MDSKRLEDRVLEIQRLETFLVASEELWRFHRASLEVVACRSVFVAILLTLMALWTSDGCALAKLTRWLAVSWRSSIG